MSTLAIRVDGDLDAALRELAQAEDRSVSGQARHLIREALDHRAVALPPVKPSTPPAPPQESRTERAARIRREREAEEPKPVAHDGGHIQPHMRNVPSRSELRGGPDWRPGMRP
jgi:hypothetical protein